MKKLLLSSLAVAALSLASLSASAASLTPNSFDVTVSLTPTCLATAATGNTGVGFGSYTSFQTSPNAVDGPTYNIKCTRGLVTQPSAAFDGVNTVVDASNATTNGVIAGLNYQLNSASTSVAGTGATAADTGRGSGGNGTATTYAFKVTGNMPGNQAGTETVAPTTQSRSLTISF